MVTPSLFEPKKKSKVREDLAWNQRRQKINPAPATPPPSPPPPTSPYKEKNAHHHHVSLHHCHHEHRTKVRLVPKEEQSKSKITKGKENTLPMGSIRWVLKSLTWEIKEVKLSFLDIKLASNNTVTPMSYEAFDEFEMYCNLNYFLQLGHVARGSIWVIIRILSLTLSQITRFKKNFQVCQKKNPNHDP